MSRLVQVTARIAPVAAGALAAVTRGPHALWEPQEGGPRIAAAGVVHSLEASGPHRFGEIVRAARASLGSIEVADVAEGPPPIVIGGAAFSPSTARGPWHGFADASFVLPRAMVISGPGATFLRVTAEDLAEARAEIVDLERRIVRTMPRPEGARDRTEGSVEHMSTGAWRALVDDALKRIGSRELDKLVAARCSVVSMATPIDVPATLARLRAATGPGVVFAFDRAGATFLGRSPERLVARHGRLVTTEALAGTAADAETLLASAKDRAEHAIVVDGVRRALAKSCVRFGAAPEPLVRALPGLYHLWTPIRATLARPLHVLELVRRLHPTPAVAGAPRTPAMAWIAGHEPIPRGWYAGPVGWFDANGDGDFAVAIRSGLVRGSRAWVWTGAGIMPASDPDREYDETRVKQRTLFGALGVPA